MGVCWWFSAENESPPGPQPYGGGYIVAFPMMNAFGFLSGELPIDLPFMETRGSGDGWGTQHVGLSPSCGGGI